MKPKRNIFSFSALVVLLLLPSFQSVVGGDVLLEDNFAKLDPSWESGENVKVQDGKLIITPALDKGTHALNDSNVFDEADITVNVMLAEGGDPTETGGIVFWAKDDSNFYVLVVSADGDTGIWRLAANRWMYPVRLAPNDAVKKGFRQSNTLRVVIKGHQALAYVNDKQVGKITGTPPEGGGQVGLYGESNGKVQNAWQFSNFKVTAPQ